MKKLTIGILAHVDAGKTTLSEAILYTAGKIRSLGRVDKGNAYLDTFELEKKRGITIFSKQANFTYDDLEITLLDTPGHVDFSAEMERVLGVLDYAILVISGPDKVQGHTKTLWRLLKKYNIPVFLFINKMDQVDLDKNLILKDLKDSLNNDCIDFTNNKSQDFIENIASSDEELLDEYLTKGEINEARIPQLIKDRKIFPCFFGSGLRLTGIDDFLQAIKKYSLETEYDDNFSMKVFKISRDKQNNRLTFVKILGGELSAKDKINEINEKVNEIRVYSGEKYESLQVAKAGCICALTGLNSTHPQQVFGEKKDVLTPSLSPVLTYAIKLPDETDPVTFLPKLREIEEEEPSLHVEWNEKNKIINVQVMGAVQMEILQSLIKDKFDIDIEFDGGSIVYKETISSAAEGVGHFEPLRHYAEVHLWLEPGPIGSGFKVATTCREDMLDLNWQRLIMTHLLEKEHIGVLTGNPLTDIKVTLIAGRAHLKHTEGGDFRQATYRALRQGLMKANSILLEPYYDFYLQVPQNCIGRAMTDIERMHGRFELVDPNTLEGSAPVSTMQNYQLEVASYTKGEGRLQLDVSGYKPCHNADEVIMAKKYNPDADEENPSGSIFCAHGAGFFVPWNKVSSYMHIQTDLSEKEGKDKVDLNSKKKKIEKNTESIGSDEIDKILAGATHANSKKPIGARKDIGGALKKEFKGSKKKETDYKKIFENKKEVEKYLLVDGYNIIFTWEKLNSLAKENINSAREKLQDILCDYQGYTGVNLLLVFDAYRVHNHKEEVYDYHNIKVIYTKEAETADQFIEKFAHVHSKKFDVTVATSDGLEQTIIRGEGAKLFSAREFEREVDRVKNQYFADK